MSGYPIHVRKYLILLFRVFLIHLMGASLLNVLRLVLEFECNETRCQKQELSIREPTRFSPVTTHTVLLSHERKNIHTSLNGHLR